MLTFEEWCLKCIKIKDKTTRREIPFALNAPQRRIARILEEDRVAGRPMRLIILKARQWGCSTLIIAYIAWLQLVISRNWNAAICAHNKDASLNIIAMYDGFLENYPLDKWEGAKPPKLRTFKRSENIKHIAERGCRVMVCTANSKDASRSGDFQIAHFSETAFWKTNKGTNPDDVVASISTSVQDVPNTLIVMESTARGHGNFFHEEYIRCRDGRGDKRAIFVPWFEIEKYREEPADPVAFEASLNGYEQMLRDKLGCDLAQINWYRNTSRKYKNKAKMMEEYPSTDEEAFATTGRHLFPIEKVEELMRGCREPIRQADIVGALSESATLGIVEKRHHPVLKLSENQTFHSPTLSSISATLAARPRFNPYGYRRRYASPHRTQSALGILEKIDSHSAITPLITESQPEGNLKIWEEPEKGGSYVAAVDIGGTSEQADYSVVAILRTDADRPEVVAQWRGHIDHDILGRKAIALATYYNTALLVIESNTFESNKAGAAIFNDIAMSYPNLYRRPSGKKGFHSNAATKEAVIANLMIAVRDGLYVERDVQACHEMLAYQITERGSYEAEPGSHDDILMTRAIALYLISLFK